MSLPVLFTITFLAFLIGYIFIVYFGNRGQDRRFLLYPTQRKVGLTAILWISRIIFGNLVNAYPILNPINTFLTIPWSIYDTYFQFSSDNISTIELTLILAFFFLEIVYLYLVASFIDRGIELVRERNKN